MAIPGVRTDVNGAISTGSFGPYIRKSTGGLGERVLLYWNVSVSAGNVPEAGFTHTSFRADI